MNTILLLGTTVYSIPLPIIDDTNEKVIAENIKSMENSVSLAVNGIVRSIISDKEYTFKNAFMVSGSGCYGLICEPKKVHYWGIKNDILISQSFSGKTITWGRISSTGVYEVIADGSLYICIKGEVVSSVCADGIKLIRADGEVVLYEEGFVYNNVIYNIGRSPQKVVIYNNTPVVLLDGILYVFKYDITTKMFMFSEITVKYSLEDNIDIGDIEDMALEDSKLIVLCNKHLYLMNLKGIENVQDMAS